jgi:putative SOS response-associated peptidase YedK
MEKIHDRMPVILDRESEQRWIGENSPESLLSLLKPCDPSTLTAYPVSSLVNSPRNDSPEILVPAGEPLG